MFESSGRQFSAGRVVRIASTPLVICRIPRKASVRPVSTLRLPLKKSTTSTSWKIKALSIILARTSSRPHNLWNRPDGTLAANTTSSLGAQRSASSTICQFLFVFLLLCLSHNGKTGLAFTALLTRFPRPNGQLVRPGSRPLDSGTPHVRVGLFF